MKPDEPREWRRLADEYRADTGQDVKRDLTSPETRVRLVEHSLAKNRRSAYRLIDTMSEEERKQLLPTFVEVVCYYFGNWGQFADHIINLPKPWVVEQIRPLVNDALDKVDEMKDAGRPSDATIEEAYLMYLNIYHRLDQSLCNELAQRALNHPDEDVREHGEFFLKS